MSGTSVDGIDVAAIEMGDDGATVLPDAAHFAYAPELRARVLRAAAGASVGTHELAALHAALGDAYADAASDFVERLGRRPDLIALHGQTVAHLPRKATLQLGDASRVAVRTGRQLARLELGRGERRVLDLGCGHGAVAQLRAGDSPLLQLGRADRVLRQHAGGVAHPAKRDDQRATGHEQGP